LLASLAPEPPATESGLTKLSLRLPSGERLIRRFRTSDTVKNLYDFVETRDLTPLPIESDFVLVNTFPRKIYKDMSQTLQESGLAPNASLIVEEKLDDE
jgi:FAS-associated factor 2